MKSHTRRLFALLFALLLSFSSLFLCAYTETDDFFLYSTDENGNAVILGYSGYNHTLTIPSTIDGMPVVAVAETAFYANREIRKITVSRGIQKIEKDAFAYCENLNSVRFEDGSCSFIGESAFEGCALLETLKLPDTVAEIDDFAFQNCIRLGRVEIPASLARIGYHAFNGCESLVFDARQNEMARDYAAENSIDLSFKDSSGFLWLEILLLCAALLLLIVLAVCLFLRRKKAARKSKKG